MLNPVLEEQLVEEVRKLIDEDVIAVGENTSALYSTENCVPKCFQVLKNAYIGSRKKIYLL